LLESYGDKTIVVITIGVVASVIGVLLVISVVTIISLKYRKANDDREDEDAFSDLPNWVNVFDTILYPGPWTNYPMISRPSSENLAYTPFDSNGRDETMDSYRV
jgi:hypothetical protein